MWCVTVCPLKCVVGTLHSIVVVIFRFVWLECRFVFFAKRQRLWQVGEQDILFLKMTFLSSKSELLLPSLRLHDLLHIVTALSMPHIARVGNHIFIVSKKLAVLLGTVTNMTTKGDVSFDFFVWQFNLRFYFDSDVHFPAIDLDGTRFARQPGRIGVHQTIVVVSKLGRILFCRRLRVYLVFSSPLMLLC